MGMRIQTAQKERMKEVELAGPRGYGMQGKKAQVTFDYGMATQQSVESPSGGRSVSTKGHGYSVPSGAQDDFAAALSVVSKGKSKKSLYASAVSGSDEDSDTFGGYPKSEVYSHQFITKPFGMEWKTTKTDKQNLYVFKVVSGSYADEGGIKMGSKLLSFNGQMIEHMGAKKIHAKLRQAELPLTITFLKPKIEKPTSMNQVKSDSHDTPEPPRVSSQAPPGDSPKAIDQN